MKSLIERLIICLVFLLLSWTVCGCKNETDKGWRLTENGTLEVYKDGVVITGRMLHYEDEPNEPEYNIPISESKQGFWTEVDPDNRFPKYTDTKNFGRVYHDKELYEKETGKKWPYKYSGLNYIEYYEPNEPILKNQESRHEGIIPYGQQSS